MRKELEKLRYLDGCPWGMVMPSEREIVNHLVEAGMERVGEISLPWRSPTRRQASLSSPAIGKTFTFSPTKRVTISAL